MNDEKLNFSRRSFVKGVLAAGVSGSLYGCSGGGDDEVIYLDSGGSGSVESDDIYYTQNPLYSYGAPGHNCGGQCLTRAQITREGRIIRILNEHENRSYDGTFFDINHRNSPLTRACSRCRSYKGRLYHPGRLRYPLKQTKERGDMSGFVRITWPQALREITERLKAVQNKYGYEAFHSITANGNYASPFQGGGQSGLFANSDLSIHWQGPAIRLLGGATIQACDYSYHQGYQMGGMAGETFVGNHTAGVNLRPSTNDVAGCGKYVFLMGSNKATTNNTNAWSWRKALEDMKARDPESRIIYISPELSEGATAVADEWVQMKPYTDAALYNAMVYEMLVNTFDGSGNILTDASKAQPWLDLDYIDTLVYGFFDSPGYWHNEATGEIDLTIPAPDILAATPAGSGGKREFQLIPSATFGSWTNSTASNQKICWIDEVPDGKSWSAYIMGDDPRLTLTAYGEGNYIVQQYTNRYAGIKRNKALCQYPSVSGKYAYKKDMMTPKSPEWAEKITGIPAAKIRELAKIFVAAGKNKEPLYIEWSGGSFKQANGCYTIFAMQAAQIISKNWGITGSGYSNMISPAMTAPTAGTQVTINEVRPATWGSPFNYFLPNTLGGAGTADVPVTRHQPQPSCTQWHNAVKFAFGDVLVANGYEPNIPDWQEGPATGRAYADDGGVKALVRRDSANPYTEITTFSNTGLDGITRTYYEYTGHNAGNMIADGAPTTAGFRFLFNVGGNIAISQHMNTTDTHRMYKALPTYGYDDGSRNVPDMANAFYLVTFENIMAPGARYSDYVLPAQTSWEQTDFIPLLSDRDNIFVNGIVPAPGEAKSVWQLARDWIQVYGGDKAARAFTGGNGSEDFKDVFQEKYYASAYYAATGSPLEEYMKKPYVRSKPDLSTTYTITANILRQELDDYIAALDKVTPSAIHPPFICKINTVGYSVAAFYSHVGRDFAETDTCPRPSRKFHMYSGSLVWQYENAFSKWHGHLPLNEQGQRNEDSEGDPEIYPIPIYLHFQDWFRDAYGLNNNSELENRFVMTTSHPKYRSHSTHAVNPYLREMSNSIEKGGINSGNDAGDYAVSKGDFIAFDPLNRLIGEDGLPVSGAEDRASYSDILVNDLDFADWEDGTLAKIENEIGAVYCTIRKTARCVRGYVNLNEGSWFDPRIINGRLTCVGGAANTLMASTPSRIDHGNAQQSAMVKITKVR
jgi:anaerobic selenocysteine-containing dehydrogenase